MHIFLEKAIRDIGKKIYMELPFNEESLGKNEFIRTFSQDTDSGELVWHRDREDRIISPLVPTDWKFQMDNELPVPIEGEIFIQKGVFHRVIKGTGDLVIKLVKLD